MYRLRFVCIFFVFGYTLKAQEPNDWDWVNRHFKGVLDEFMPWGEYPGYVVSFRSFRDLYTDEHEYSFVIKQFKGKSTAIVRMPVGKSIYDQLMELHLSNPSGSIQELKKSLKVQEFVVDENKCKELTHLISSFQELCFTPPGSRSVLHPRIYHIQVNEGEMDVVLTDEKHDLVQWILKTKKIFNESLKN